MPPKSRLDQPTHKYAHSFPKTILRHLGHKIYVNGTEILTPTTKHPYPIKPLKTYLVLGQEIADEPEQPKYAHISVERLRKETGYTVVSKRAGNLAWRPNQKIYYYITKQRPGLREIIKPNINHYIEHDEYNKKVRGIGDCFANQDGKSGRTKTDWVLYDPPPKTMPRRVWQGGEEELIEDIEARWAGEDEEEQENVLQIKELPVMITNNNYLLCIPKHPGGSKDIQRILFVGMPGYGKCQPAGSKVLMSDGEWKNIEDIKMGDKVLSPQPDKTYQYSEVVDTNTWFSEDNYSVKQKNKNKKELYKCSANHLIPVHHFVKPRAEDGDRHGLSENNYWTIKNYPAKRLAELKSAGGRNNQGVSAFPIQQYEGRQNCSVEPYSLGVFLGDGSYLTYKYSKPNPKYPGTEKTSRKPLPMRNNKHSVLSITCADEEIMKEVAKHYLYISTTRKKENKAKCYRFSSNSEFAKELRKHGLKDKKSGDKFIPATAMFSDLEYRKKLLAGLIDTDGYYQGGGYEITTKSEALANDILNLIYSIGGRGEVYKTKKTIKRLGFSGEYHRTRFYLHDMKIPLQVDRKIKHIKSKYLSSNRLAISLHKSSPCQVYGITLDSPSQWYITDNWVVTHNSFGMSSLLGRIYYGWEDLIGMLNDVLGQFQSVGIPNKSVALLRTLNRIGNEPLPLPAVYLYMSAPDIHMKHHNEGVGFRQVVSLYDFLGRYTFFTYGIKRWALEGKEKYLIDLKKGLASCRDAEQFKAVLYAKFGGAEGEEGLRKDKGTKQMITKMHDAFSEIFNEQFLDSQFRDEPTTAAQWKLVKSDGEVLVGPPFIISAEAELLPVIDTTRASETSHFRNAMADLLKNILIWQIERKRADKQKRFWVAVDELQTIYELGKKRDNAAEALERLFRQGRFNQIGFLGNTQSYEKLHEDIRKYNTHLFCTNIPSAKERTMIQKDYDLSKEQADELGRLERFEFLAISKEPWVTYDSYGRRRVYKNAERTFRGKIIPPINTHLSP